MTPREKWMVDTLEEPVRSIVFEAFRFFSYLDGGRWRLSLPGRHACKRTWQEQYAIFMRGRKLVRIGKTWEHKYVVTGKTVTKCDGFRRKSYHQSGWAVDIGFRDTGTKKFTWYVEGNALFGQLVAFLGEAGLSWAGYWPDPWDWHHFQMEGA